MSAGSVAVRLKRLHMVCGGRNRRCVSGVVLALVVLAGCNAAVPRGPDRTATPLGQQATPETPATPAPTARPTQARAPLTQAPAGTAPPTQAPAEAIDSVEAEAREHCPDQVPEFYEGCVNIWVRLVEAFPDTALVLCVWPDGRHLIAEPGTEGAGREIGEDCHSESSGRGFVAWIVNEAR